MPRPRQGQPANRPHRPDPHDGYRPIFQRGASFDDNPAIRHYGVACDESTGELCLIEGEGGRVTGHVHLPREIAAAWIEAIADYVPRYRNLFGDRPYYPNPLMPKTDA